MKAWKKCRGRQAGIYALFIQFMHVPFDIIVYDSFFMLFVTQLPEISLSFSLYSLFLKHEKMWEKERKTKNNNHK